MHYFPSCTGAAPAYFFLARWHFLASCWEFFERAHDGSEIADKPLARSQSGRPCLIQAFVGSRLQANDPFQTMFEANGHDVTAVLRAKTVAARPAEKL